MIGRLDTPKIGFTGLQRALHFWPEGMCRSEPYIRWTWENIAGIHGMARENHPFIDEFLIPVRPPVAGDFSARWIIWQGHQMSCGVQAISSTISTGTSATSAALIHWSHKKYGKNGVVHQELGETTCSYLVIEARLVDFPLPGLGSFETSQVKQLMLTHFTV